MSRRHHRLRTFVSNYLIKEGPKNTQQITMAFNQHSTHGTTTRILGSVLSKYKNYEQAGFDHQAHSVVWVWRQ